MPYATFRYSCQTGSPWLSLALSGSEWLFLWQFLALYGALWLTVSLGVSLALIGSQGACSVCVVVAALHSSTLSSPGCNYALSSLVNQKEACLKYSAISINQSFLVAKQSNTALFWWGKKLKIGCPLSQAVKICYLFISI